MEPTTTPTRRVRRNAAKLTEDQVREVRTQYAAGTPKRVLAEEYGVTRMAVHWIVLRRTWADLPD